MRKITEKIVRAFLNGETLRIDNSYTNGQDLFLFGNKIAVRTGNGLWISNAGWKTKTTKERLNGLPNVRIQQVRGEWYLNGREWNGEWVNVGAWTDGIEYITLPQSEPEVVEPEFDVTSEWVGTHSKPIYSVYHTHDERDLERAESILKENDIPSRRMYSDTQGTYLPNHFIVVQVQDMELASSLIN